MKIKLSDPANLHLAFQQPIFTFWGTVFFTCLLVILSGTSAGKAKNVRVFPNPQGIVAFCFDGDTVKLTDRRVIRIAGIDTPEIKHGANEAQFFSREARHLLDNLTKGRKISLLQVGEKCRDNYGRLIADIILENGSSVSETMIKQGAAFYYPHEDLFPEHKKRLLTLQKEAIVMRCGMWKELLDLPLAKQPFIGNRASLRFFPAHCPEAKRIKPRNKISFANLMDAFSAGYAPARICLFWPPQQ